MFVFRDVSTTPCCNLAVSTCFYHPLLIYIMFFWCNVNQKSSKGIFMSVGMFQRSSHKESQQLYSSIGYQMARLEKRCEVLLWGKVHQSCDIFGQALQQFVLAGGWIEATSMAFRPPSWQSAGGSFATACSSLELLGTSNAAEGSVWWQPLPVTTAEKMESGNPSTGLGFRELSNSVQYWEPSNSFHLYSSTSGFWQRVANTFLLQNS